MTKKIFIEIPTWLSDAVMVTPAIENIINTYPKCRLTIFGSNVSTSLFKNHPNVKKIIIDTSKNSGNRYLNLRDFAKSVGKFDMAFSFRKNFTTAFLLWFIDAKNKFKYKRYDKRQKHQVVRYNDFVNKSLSITTYPNDLKVYLNQNIKNKTNSAKLKLGINPGAAYGSAKRWYPEKFAKVAIELSKEYDIIIFGGSNETKMAKDIAKILKKSNVKNYTNLAGKTNIDQLIENIYKLDLFITNDNGPMHLAASFKIPTVCIFGPTKYQETSQWNNPQSMLIKKEFKCMPCMKRECPLEDKENHQCMKSITANDILDTIYYNVQALDMSKKKLQKDFLSKYNIDKKTKIILFKANNFRQNGAVRFLRIISNLNETNFQAVISGDSNSIKFALNWAKEIGVENKILFLENFAIKICDIFVLPTTNKKFANNVLKAMKERCVVFVPNTNEASTIVDVFATMQGANDPNTSYKIDALLSNKNHLRHIKKENQEKAQYINN
ncbi:ADP-heptose--lipooligosaccharide heptosyltransferase II [hydrothermal vent metagenome]|uniref:lipopolysaccharide heptosyltransferase II n=1 Tax=hydrothermal vent metagenome TaxID=652676 RepID=A0A3B1DSD2_9ZZZZ